MISEMWQRKAYILPTTIEMKSFMEKKIGYVIYGPNMKETKR